MSENLQTISTAPLFYCKMQSINQGVILISVDPPTPLYLNSSLETKGKKR